MVLVAVMCCIVIGEDLGARIPAVSTGVCLIQQGPLAGFGCAVPRIGVFEVWGLVLQSDSMLFPRHLFLGALVAGFREGNSPPLFPFPAGEGQSGSGCFSGKRLRLVSVFSFLLPRLAFD